MSISRGILPRALPLNSRFARLALVLAAIALVSFTGSIHAQTIDTTAYAVLAEGPVRGRGIDGIYPNVIPYWHSVYLVARETIDLFLVEGPIAGAERWPLSDCRLQTLRSPGPTLYYYDDMGGWSVLFQIAESAVGDDGAGDESLPEVVCDFADRLIDRFLYFKRTAPEVDPNREPVPAMPAIVELN